MSSPASSRSILSRRPGVTIRRRDGGIGAFEKAGFAVALGVVAAGLGFIAAARNSPTGTIANTPPQAFYVFVLVGGIAAARTSKCC